MKPKTLLRGVLVLLAGSLGSSTAFADSTDATCQVRKEGETKHGMSGPCTFSQRQGYIDIDLKNGQTISLRPANQANHYKDQGGHKVVRTQAGGDTQEFKWESGKKVTVTFTRSSYSGGGGGGIAVGDMPRYCMGEASAKFHVNPRDITTQNATRTHGMYEVWGQYGAQAQVFICSFNAEHQFLSVKHYRP